MTVLAQPQNSVTRPDATVHEHSEQSIDAGGQLRVGKALRAGDNGELVGLIGLELPQPPVEAQGVEMHKYPSPDQWGRRTQGPQNDIADVKLLGRVKSTDRTVCPPLDRCD
jgi:hypothetical protein